LIEFIDAKASTKRKPARIRDLAFSRKNIYII